MDARRGWEPNSEEGHEVVFFLSLSPSPSRARPFRGRAPGCQPCTHPMPRPAKAAHSRGRGKEQRGKKERKKKNKQNKKKAGDQLWSSQDLHTHCIPCFKNSTPLLKIKVGKKSKVENGFISVKSIFSFPSQQSSSVNVSHFEAAPRFAIEKT